jgi:hypothetical protein
LGILKFFGNFGGILWQFFGNSLLNSLEIVNDWFPKSADPYALWPYDKKLVS